MFSKLQITTSQLIAFVLILEYNTQFKNSRILELIYCIGNCYILYNILYIWFLINDCIEFWEKYIRIYLSLKEILYQKSFEWYLHIFWFDAILQKYNLLHMNDQFWYNRKLIHHKIEIQNNFTLLKPMFLFLYQNRLSFV